VTHPPTARAPRRGPRRLAAVLACCLVVAAAGCAPGPEERPRPVADDRVPFDLLAPEDSTPATTSVGDEPVVIYLLANEVLVPATRLVPEGDVRTVLGLLEDGVTESEATEGLSSPLDDGDDVALVADASLSRGVATVDLSRAFEQLDGSSQLLAIAQIVLTLTNRPGIGQVSFRLEGTPIDVPRGDGTTTGEPVTRGDYRTLLDDRATR
jgi:hypothetical protein